MLFWGTLSYSSPGHSVPLQSGLWEWAVKIFSGVAPPSVTASGLTLEVTLQRAGIQKLPFRNSCCWVLTNQLRVPIVCVCNNTDNSRLAVFNRLPVFLPHPSAVNQDNGMIRAIITALSLLLSHLPLHFVNCDESHTSALLQASWSIGSQMWGGEIWR